MNRSLTDAENKVLSLIQDKVKEIVDAGVNNRLQATGLLGNPAANQQAYTDFDRRFQQLPVQFQEVRADNRFWVNTNLDPSVGANAPTRVKKGVPEADVEITKDWVSDKPTATLTTRAIKLIHELTHTIYEAPEFPVKDYAYRNSWALEYLPANIGACNADTYAEAAAQIAGELENRPRRYREGARLSAQRHTLSGLQPAGLIVGPALAWADIMINRAWLRGLDYQSFAASTVSWLLWSSTLEGWRTDPAGAALLAIEDGLRGDKMGKIIGDRSGLLDIGLSDADVLTAKNIRGYMTTLKDALSLTKMTLTDMGQVAITFTQGAHAHVLGIPRALALGDSYTLGELIVDVIVNSFDYTDNNNQQTAKLNTRKRAIVDLLTENDRPGEIERVREMRHHFQRIQSAAPNQVDWGSASIDLDLAAVRGTAEYAERMAEVAHEAATNVSMREHLTTLHGPLQPQVQDAVQIGTSYNAQGAPVLTQAQTQVRKDSFSRLAGALVDISNEVASYDKDLVPLYDGFIRSVTPLAG